MVKAKVAAKAKPNPKGQAKTGKVDKAETRTKAQAKADNPGRAKANNADVAMQEDNEEEGKPETARRTRRTGSEARPRGGTRLKRVRVP